MSDALALRSYGSAEFGSAQSRAGFVLDSCALLCTLSLMIGISAAGMDSYSRSVTIYMQIGQT